MVLTASTMLPLGSVAPGFSLPAATGGKVRLEDFAGSAGLLVMFLCNHCPYVKHVQHELAAIGREYIPRKISMVAINANDSSTHPDDSFAMMLEEVERVGYPFPYLHDESQEVAKAYHAACTPDFFLFDGENRLVYRGQLDDSRPGRDVPVTGRDLRRAMDTLLAGRPISEEQQPSMGCNIKWKSGNAPTYFSG
jgi:peroxiredoxin